MNDQHSNKTTFTFSHVTTTIVLTALRSINVRKSAGCDLIPGKLIKEGVDFLCKLIQSFKGVFKGRGGGLGGSGGLTPPPKIFRFFLKNEGKEMERKRKKEMLGGGGGYLLTYFWG